ncbi:hypothetical protein BH11CYA1_BH11CYA1_43370 [soil metagenome]
MVTSISSDKIIDQRYQIVTTIGQGGMGKVYLVVDLEKNRQVALKTLERDLNDQATWGRFEREARNASRLNHPNIARVYDFGKLNGEVPYLVMELVSGQTLHDRIKAKGPLSEGEVLVVFLAMASALQHAHQMDTLHRDIKPANIVVITDKIGKIVDAKLIDFGLAKCFAEGEFAQSLTATGELIGSPFYMSPEHWNSEPLGPGSDLYSLGITLFEALTAKVPFSGENAFATAVSHNTSPLPLLANFSNSIIDDSDWQIVLNKMLAKSIDDRYLSPAQFAHDLNCIARGEAVNPDVDSLSNEETRKPFKINNLVLLLGASAIFLFLTYMVSWAFFSILAKTPNTRASRVAFERMPGNNDRALEAKPDFTIFHDNLRHIFHFPRSDKLGLVEVGNDGVERLAIGDIEVKYNEKMLFRPSDLFLMHPELFKKFGANDLTNLYLQGTPAVINDTVISNISHLTRLRHLVIRDCSITEKAINTLNCLPNLDSLTFDDDEIDGAALTKLKRLTMLDSLNANDVKNPRPYLIKLVKSQSLRNLSLKATNLTDDDLKLVSQIPGLKELAINNNPLITNKGLAYLSRCNKLKKLQIKNISATAGCGPILGRIKSLKTLVLESETIGEPDLAALRRLLPDCNIDFGVNESGEAKLPTDKDLGETLKRLNTVT